MRVAWTVVRPIGYDTMAMIRSRRMSGDSLSRAGIMRILRRTCRAGGSHPRVRQSFGPGGPDGGLSLSEAAAAPRPHAAAKGPGFGNSFDPAGHSEGTACCTGSGPLTLQCPPPGHQAQGHHGQKPPASPERLWLQARCRCHQRHSFGPRRLTYVARRRD
jgi:hypothetical protein